MNDILPPADRVGNEPPVGCSDAHAELARKHLTPAPDEYGRTPRTDAAIAAGHALLAVHQELGEIRAETAAGRVGLRDELAGVRCELADVAAAVRELTAAVVSADGPMFTAADHLESIAAGVDRAAAAGEGLADVAAAVDALAGEVRDRPRRRSWRGRLRRRFASEVGEVRR